MFRFERRLRRPGLRGLLLRNTVTGMTVTMRRRTVELALPFPPQAGQHFFHDLWLALVAEATGGIAVIGDPLVDYRQHGGNVLGAVDRRARRRFALPRFGPMRQEAAPYALARYLAQSLHNRMTDAVMAGTLPHGTARVGAIRPYLRRLGGSAAHLFDAARLAVTGHLRLSRIAAGFAVVTLGRSVWALRQALTAGLAAAVDRFDERLYSLSPGVLPVPPRHMLPPQAEVRAAQAVVDARKAARFKPDFRAPAPCLNILVPTLNPSEIFAGIATALDIGCGLAARGIPVRFIATDLPVSSAATTRLFLEPRLRAAGPAAAAVEIACGVSSPEVRMHRGDLFFCTAWWTAHLARRLIETQGFAHDRFVYLIQDHEPHFYAWGPEFADAEASYAMDFDPVFNTTLLRDFFRLNGHRFAGPEAPAFHPSIDIDLYARGARPAPGARRRIAVYGRPEVPRNMFPTAVEALARFIDRAGLTPAEVEVISVGLRHAPLALPRGVMLESLGKLPFSDYPAWLLGVDVGLSLMLSPHPSHPPIEMAAAGARVVTNRFANKDLGQLSPAILSVDADAAAVAEGLARAWALPPVADADRRIDLSRLGAPLAEVTDDLARRLRPRLGLGLAPQ
jgi:hypothetical protein